MFHFNQRCHERVLASVKNIQKKGAVVTGLEISADIWAFLIIESSGKKEFAGFRVKVLTDKKDHIEAVTYPIR